MNKLVALISSLFLALSCLAGSQAADLIVEASRSHYRNSQSVNFYVENSGRHVLEAYIAVEVASNDGLWSSWGFRVEDGALGAMPTKYRLAPGERIRLCFDIKKSKLPPIPKGQVAHFAASLTFRFRFVFYSASTHVKLGEGVSAPFVMDGPYYFLQSNGSD